MLTQSPWIWVWMALACASISYTMTKTPVFDWLRARLKTGSMVHQLWTCPYCISHYVAAVMILVAQPRPLTGGWLDLIIGLFVVVTLSAYAVLVMSLGKEVVAYLRSL